MIPIDIIISVIISSLCCYYENFIFPLFCDCSSTINNLITYIYIYNLKYLKMNFYSINYYKLHINLF